MNRDHIIEILDNSPLARLSEQDRATITLHIKDCESCRRAYQAAEFSTLLVSEQAAEAAQNALSANPFFQTRVLAAWRERRETSSVSALRRVWNASGALIASMAATTAALAALTLIIPGGETTPSQTAMLAPYSAETVVFEQSDNKPLTDDEVISDIYADDDEGK